MSRYPDTYAADILRGWAGYNSSGTKLSRSDASHIRSEIAKTIGMDDAELARKLADRYQRESAEESTAQAEDWAAARMAALAFTDEVKG